MRECFLIYFKQCTVHTHLTAHSSLGWSTHSALHGCVSVSDFPHFEEHDFSTHLFSSIIPFLSSSPFVFFVFRLHFVVFVLSSSLFIIREVNRCDIHGKLLTHTLFKWNRGTKSYRTQWLSLTRAHAHSIHTTPQRRRSSLVAIITIGNTGSGSGGPLCVLWHSHKLNASYTGWAERADVSEWVQIFFFIFWPQWHPSNRQNWYDLHFYTTQRTHFHRPPFTKLKNSTYMDDFELRHRWICIIISKAISSSSSSSHH